MSDQTLVVENATKTDQTLSEVAPDVVQTSENQAAPIQNINELNPEKKTKKKKKNKKSKAKLSIEAPAFQPTQFFQFDPTLQPIQKSLSVEQPTLKKETIDVPAAKSETV